MECKKDQFCDFLANLSKGCIRDGDWDEYVVNHYADIQLERARIDLVRASIQHGNWNEIPESLRVFAKELLNRLQNIS